jgi:glycine cleavage system H protein
MSDTHIPSELKYTSSHEWSRLESDGTITVGITYHAQHLLGDIVYIELPEIDKAFSQGKEIAVVESVKAASDIYAPVSGKVIAVNQELSANPELVNQSPYESGWMFKLKPDNTTDLDNLLSSIQYNDSITEE